ncbi:hypothetical protein [Kitasatospora purpeofusca]|uniref:hypothetical protein n=1 Tax=Kitasatospora purpeofusca TaxID=67352 RepID=UPI002A5AE565|nr:hypothetical protein [Kitasatospora purpeofusca]MDY0816777.1 hypothetical protein [Kitasatospora purpeofusca]
MKKLFTCAAMALALVPALIPSATAQAAPVSDGPAAVSEACDWNFPGNGPAKAIILCNSWPAQLIWPDGRGEYVVIGSDRQVWHSYQYSPNGSWSVWGTLGNSHDVRSGVWSWFSNGYPTVEVLGGDDRYWCNRYIGNGTWSNWDVC